MVAPTRKKKGFLWAVSLMAAAVGVTLAITGASFADNFQSDGVVAGGPTSITSGGSATVTYKLIGNSGGGDPVAGCNVDATHAATVTVNAPAGVSKSPSSFQFTDCGNAGAKTVSFSSSTPGTYSISHSISGGKSGALYTNQANFTLQVNPPVQQNTAPQLSVPGPIIAEAAGAGGATVNYSVSASDAEDNPDPAPSCSPASGTLFQIGNTQVNCSVTDSGSLTTTGSFDVTVVDTTAPVLSLPADKVVEATGPSGRDVSYSASASDLVDGALSASCLPASGSTFALGATTVNCSASDAAGNSANGSFSVTVVDTTAPVLSLPAAITAAATGISGAVVTYSASASDLVSGSVAVSCSPASGSTFAPGMTTVNCFAMDAASNTATGSFTVTVNFAASGFYQPVDMTPPGSLTVWNTVKNGSTVPLKFEVFAGSTELTDIAAVIQPLRATGVSCLFGTADDIELLSSGSTSLRYDTSGGQFIYNWQTPKKVGACYRVTVSMIDGASLSAYFKLK